MGLGWRPVPLSELQVELPDNDLGRRGAGTLRARDVQVADRRAGRHRRGERAATRIAARNPLGRADADLAGQRLIRSDRKRAARRREPQRDAGRAVGRDDRHRAVRDRDLHARRRPVSAVDAARECAGRAAAARRRSAVQCGRIGVRVARTRVAARTGCEGRGQESC